MNSDIYILFVVLKSGYTMEYEFFSEKERDAEYNSIQQQLTMTGKWNEVAPKHTQNIDNRRVTLVTSEIAALGKGDILADADGEAGDDFIKVD